MGENKRTAGMRINLSQEWFRKVTSMGDEPDGCRYCGAIAGACSEYPRCPTGYENGAHARFFIDHGVVHDLKTGQHVGASFEPDNAERLLALLTELGDHAARVAELENWQREVCDRLGLDTGCGQKWTSLDVFQHVQWMEAQAKAKAEAEAARLREAGNKAVSLLDEVVYGHTDKYSVNYNECQDDECAWCALAKEVIAALKDTP